MNRTQIIGNLGADAEVRHIDGSQSAISFSVGVSERWTDKNTGEKREKTDWFRCTLWKPADKTSIAQYLKKGTKVLAEGKVSSRAWSNPTTGELNSQIELNVQNLEFVSPAPQAQTVPGHNDMSSGNPAPMPAAQPIHSATPLQPTGPINTSDKIAAANAAADEDLPF